MAQVNAEQHLQVLLIVVIVQNQSVRNLFVGISDVFTLVIIYWFSITKPMNVRWEFFSLSHETHFFTLFSCLSGGKNLLGMSL